MATRLEALVACAAPLALLMLAACPSNPPTKGKFDGEVYASPHGNYSIPMPFGSGLGRVVRDDARDLQGKEGVVSIFNDMGDLRTVEYTEIPETERDRFEGGDVQGSLRWGYREGVVTSRLKDFPGTRSLHDEALELEDGPAHFGIAFIPGGSVLVPANAIGLPSSKHCDTLRGFLVFTRDGFFYVLGCTYSDDGIKPDLALTPAHIDAYKRSLVALRASMRFPPPR